MNSWIGGSLSSLKGQLTHLITEGTEEISDPKGDLVVAKLKINELESQMRCLSSDAKELNERNNELKIKLQSDEMLFQNVSDSYKEKLKQKEECIELLRDQLSSKASLFDNGGVFSGQNDPSLMRGDEWSSEFYDFVNQSSEQTPVSRSGLNEADLLRQRICELGQEVLRMRSVAESAQCNRQDYIGDPEEGSVTKLLEIQRQDMELQHSNYILELQQEHNKQLNFLKRSSHQWHRLSDDDDEPFPSEISDSINNIRQLSEERTLCSSKVDVTDSAVQTFDESMEYRDINVASAADERHLKLLSQTTDTSVGTDHSPTLYDIACQCSIETQMSDITMADNSSYRLSQSGGHNIGDSMSQFSDISEVSVRSRLLDEHVRHLSTRIDEYGYQLTSSEDIALTPIDGNDPEELTNKLQHLKMKLSQRKNIIIEQNNLLTDAEIRGLESTTCADSWENSSDNSLVQEPNLDIKHRNDLESLIHEVYHILYLHYPGNDLSVMDTLALIKDMVSNIGDTLENEKMLSNGLLDLSNEIVGSSPPRDNVAGSFDCIKTKFNELNTNMERLMETHSSLENIVKNYECEKVELEDKITELEKKNAEFEEKLEDMSSTIIRYENLEKVCDTYERELYELKGCGKKTDLGMDSEDILEHVKTFNEEKDECIEKLESRIIFLQNFCEEKDDFIKAMKEREIEVIYEYDCSIDVLNSELDSVRETVEKSYENEIECKKQIYRMNVCLREKDEMIISLNEELTMLSHQNTDEDLVIMSKNDNIEEASQTEEVKMIEYGEDYTIRCEESDVPMTKDIIEAQDNYNIIHEQSGILMTENKRLEEVIEAQANSLGQYEARVNSLEAEISRLSRSSEGMMHPESSEEMTRETLHHLSKMIRDKDWEIEALKCKNDSLCSIIKQSGENSDADTFDPIEKLLNEKETLSKEVLWYQENREQLVNALNLKHKESLNYHGEIQRLVAYMTTEQMKWNDLSAENESIKDEIRILREEKSTSKFPGRYLVDTAVEFRDDLPSYDECVESTNNDQYKSLKERVTNLEQENRHSFGEIRRLEKQLEHVSFELEESRLQFNELMASHDRCETQMAHYQEELAKMCKADVASNQLVDKAKDIWNETEETKDIVEPLGDQSGTVDVSDQIRIYQLQCEDYVHQIDQLKAKEVKLLKEKQIFQEHLIRIEESYTQDATVAEDREQFLRIQLHKTEDQLSLAQDRVAELERKVTNLTDNFLTETFDTRQERDNAVRRLQDTENRLMDTVSSLNNLQSVLDKFQQEQAMELSFQKERLQLELQSMTNDKDKWQSQCHQLQSNLESQNDIVEAAQRLTDQMERKDDQLAEMQATMSRKEEVVDNLKMEIRKLNSMTESKVDKILMRNLIIGYFHTPLNKRQDALRVIGSLLQFSDQDYHQIGIDTVNKSRWFSWLRSTSTDNKDQDNTHIQEHSFSELFIRFLERESTPLPQLRLPTNQIAAEARQHSSLSQSDDFPYVNTPSQAPPVLDHHKFFTSSPLVTKRNGASSDASVGAEGHREGPLLLVPSGLDHNTRHTPLSPLSPSLIQGQPSSLASSLSSSSSSASHRRGDSNRNALLSLLQQ